MSSLLLVCRAHWRRRRASLAGLALLVALVSAAAIFPLAGARRSASVVDRHLAAIDAYDAILQVPDEAEGFDSNGEGLDAAALARVAALPEVEALSRKAIYFVSPSGTEAIQGDGTVVAELNVETGARQLRRVLVDGRLPADDRADEVALSKTLADRMALRVGDRAALQSLSPLQLEAVFSGDEVGPPAGPRLAPTVTGILASAPPTIEVDIAFSPAFAADHPRDIASFDGIFQVWLRGGAADLDRFVADVTGIYGGTDDLFVTSTAEGVMSSRAPTRAEAAGLAILGAILGIAGLLAGGQALRRHLRGTDPDDILLALGLTARARTMVAVGSILPAVAGGLVIGSVLAIAVSGLLPFGLARDLEPSPGLQVDTTVLAGAAAVVPLLLIAATLGARRSRAAVTRRSKPSALPSVKLGPAATAGLVFAFDRARGKRSRPASGAISAVLVSSALVVGAAVFSASLSRFLIDRARQGWNWDLAFSPGDEADDTAARDVARELASDPDVASTAVLRSTSVRADGRDTSAYALDQVSGATHFTIVSGRSPTGPDEVVAGAETIRRLGTGVGRVVSPLGPDGEVEMRVVGIALFPPLDNPSAINGLGMTAEALARLEHSGGFPEVLVSAREGVDIDALEERLAAVIPLPPDSPLPSEAATLGQIRSLPLRLAAVLGVVGTASIVHSAVEALRRTRRDLGVLKALGFTRRQLAATVLWQTDTPVLAGLVLGVPLGVVVGRWSWSILAGAVGVARDPLVPAVGLAVVVPTALLIASAVAAVTGLSAARTRPAVVLREQ